MKELRDLLLEDHDGSFTTDLVARLQQRMELTRSACAPGTAIPDEIFESWAQACRSAIHVVELFASGRSR